MPITTACTLCDQQYKVLDRMAGRWVRCKVCNEKFQVPARGQGYERKRFQSRTWIKIGVAVLIVGGTVGAIVAPIFLSAPRTRPIDDATQAQIAALQSQSQELAISLGISESRVKALEFERTQLIEQANKSGKSSGKESASVRNLKQSLQDTEDELDEALSRNRTLTAENKKLREQLTKLQAQLDARKQPNDD